MALSRAFRSELGKLLRRRTTLLLALTIALLPPMLATSFSVLIRRDQGLASPWLEPTLSSPHDLQMIVFGTADLVCALLGTLTITSEFGSLTIMRTYQRFASRVPVLVGKLLALGLVVGAASLMAVGGALAILAVFGGGALTSPAPAQLAVGFVTNAVMVALFGYAFGMLLSRSLPALLTVVSIAYLLPDVVRVVVSVFHPAWAGLQQYLPTEASGAAIRAAVEGVAYSGIDPGVGTMVAAIELLVLAAAGGLVQCRRDVP